MAGRLLRAMEHYGRTLVAFSGGVDSSVVLAAAVRSLGPQQVAAVTAVSPSLPAAELSAAAGFCGALGVTHYTPETTELDNAGYRENGALRCYFCKSVLLDTAAHLAVAFDYDTIATGTNASDITAGFRPGIRAASERGARTPLADIGADKAEVRSIARAWSLPTWNKPAAACLSSRIAFGIQISPWRLGRVERAEESIRLLLQADKVDNLRVRDLGESVRLEVDQPLVEKTRKNAAVLEVIRTAGFGDLPFSVEAFRSGSMNELLSASDRLRAL